VTPSPEGGPGGGALLTAVTSTLRETEDTLPIVDVQTSRASGGEGAERPAGAEPCSDTRALELQLQQQSFTRGANAGSVGDSSHDPLVARVTNSPAA